MPEQEQDPLEQMVADVEAELSDGESGGEATGADEVDKGKAKGKDPKPDKPKGKPSKGLISAMELITKKVKDLKPSKGFRAVDTKEDDFIQLTKSIKENGLLVPLTVDGNTVESGRRRLQALKSLGVEDVSCINVTIQDGKTELVALLDNLHRKNLNPVEEAHALQLLVDTGSVKNRSALSKILGVTPGRVTQKLSILELPEGVQDAVAAARLSASAAEGLVGADKKTVDEVLADVEAGKKPTVNQVKKKTGKKVTRNAIPVPQAECPEDCRMKLTRDELVITVRIHHPSKTWKKQEVEAYMTALKDEFKDVEKILNKLRKDLDG